MNHLLPSSPALLVSMATMRKGIKAKQVTTHTHDSVPVGAYKQFKDVGHWDFKRIKAGESWEFPLMEGPACVTSIWMTVAGRMIEVVRRKRVLAHKYLWINVYYDGEKTPAISAPIGHFFGNGTTKYVHFASKFVGMTSGGYYSFLPMPFEKSCRVVMENRHEKKDIPFFFGAIGYTKMEGLPPDSGMLHAQYHASNFVGSKDVKGAMVPDNPHLILEADNGPGHFAGTTLTIYPNHPNLDRLELP